MEVNGAKQLLMKQIKLKQMGFWKQNKHFWVEYPFKDLSACPSRVSWQNLAFLTN